MVVMGYVLLGAVAGIVSGLLGIGGAIIIVPALVYIFGFGQHLAQGTSLALMLPPIGLLAVLEYYQKGLVDIKAALFICLTFFLGGLLGAKITMNLPVPLLRKIFALILLALAVRMFTQQ